MQRINLNDGVGLAVVSQEFIASSGRRCSLTDDCGSPSSFAAPEGWLLVGDAEFFSGLKQLRAELDPRGVLETFLVERIESALYNLRCATRKAGSATRGATSAAADRAERQFYRALDRLFAARDRRAPRWGKAEYPVTQPVCVADAVTLPPLDGCHDWSDPDAPFSASGGEGESTGSDDGRWQDRLVLDPNVSDSSPVVRGTWVTASQIVTFVVDGWTWDEILRAHPELTEADIRACLAYTVEDEAWGRD